MDIYSLSDTVIQQRIGTRLRRMRLRQNITQSALATDSQVSLSTVKKIEKGQVGSFDSLLRLLRVLGCLGALHSLVEDDVMSPNEYYEFVNTAKRKSRRRAAARIRNTPSKDDSEW